MPPKKTKTKRVAGPPTIPPCSVTSLPALARDFVRIPPAPGDDEDPEDFFSFPDNNNLPYDVPDNHLFQVTKKYVSRKDDPNLLNHSVNDLADKGEKKYEKDYKIIYGAYQRVTGHETLDESVGLSDPSVWDTDDEVEERKRYMYYTYACIHNNLALWRNKGELNGEGIYHIAQRLVTYAQELNPGRGLGPASAGKWWIAPPCYHLITYLDRDEDKLGHDDPQEIAALGQAKGLGFVIGFDRKQDKARFDKADFTFHPINLLRCSYTKKEADGKATGDQEKWEEEHYGHHWALIILHKATKKVYYLDSLWGKRRGVYDRWAVHDRVARDFNAWLTNYAPGATPEITEIQPVAATQQQVENSCGIHTIANIMAFICYGRLDWTALEPWQPEVGGNNKPTLTTSEPVELKMVEDVGRPVHRLMGLEFVNEEDPDDIFDTGIMDEAQNWKPKKNKNRKVQRAKLPALLAPPAPGTETDKKVRELAQKEAELVQKEKELDERAKKVDEKADEKGSRLRQLESALRGREKQLAKGQAELERQRQALLNNGGAKPPTKPSPESSDDGSGPNTQPFSEIWAEVLRRNRDSSAASRKLDQKEEQLNQADQEDADPLGEEGEVKGNDNAGNDDENQNDNTNLSPRHARRSRLNAESPLAGRSDNPDPAAGALKRKMGTLAARDEYQAKKRSRVLEGREGALQKLNEKRAAQAQEIRQRQRAPLNQQDDEQ